MIVYRKATESDLEKIWDKDIEKNNNDDCWIKWKKNYIEYNKTERAATFVVLNDDEPIGQITVLFSPECSAVKNRPMLCDGVTRANMNAFRIEKEYEGQGHISKLVDMAQNYALEKGFTYLTIGSEAKESRNLAIYLHFNYTEFITSFIEDNELVLFYGKNLLNNLEKWQFGEKNDELINLVLTGKKSATTSLYNLNELSTPFSILTFSNGENACLIKTEKVIKMKFKEMTWEYAKLEGEDKNLESWKNTHAQFFIQENKKFNENSYINFETFKVIKKLG